VLAAPLVDSRRATVRHTARVPQLRIAQDDAADELLGRDPLALLIGMLLDQHVSRGTEAFDPLTGAI
jgi:hypothetical protein